MFAQQQHDRRRFFGMAALSLAAAWIGTRDSVIKLITVSPFRLSGASDLASLGRATAWLNSAPLTAADLRGKVVLVDFWTYTCINWLRTLPYVRAWAARYKEQGLVVIGVHTPEFSFEQDIDNVRRAVTGERHHVPDRHRQRPRDLAWIRQSLLAGALLRRCCGEGARSPLRRRQLRRIGNEDSPIAGRRPEAAAGSIVSPFQSRRMVRRWAPTGAT